MRIETKFNLGDPVKFTREGGMVVCGVVTSMSIYTNKDELHISCIIHDKNGESERFNENSLELIGKDKTE